MQNLLSKESTVTTLGEQATASIVVLENTKTLRPTTFQDFETDSGCSDNNNNNCEWGCEARQSVKSFNGADGNLICGGDNKKRGSENLEKTFNSVPPGYYHLDFDYYKVDSWDGDEYGYVKINDVTCWRKNKNSIA